jgi:hypothetical protein
MSTQGQEQPPQNKHFPWVRWVIFTIAGLFLVYGTITGIMSYVTTHQGTWGSVVSLIIGTFSLLVGLYQLFLQHSTVASQTDKLDPGSSLAPVEELDLAVSGDKGLIVIFATKRLVGKTVYLYSGTASQGNLITKPLSTKRILDYKLNGQLVTAAVFRDLKPGHYTAQADILHSNVITLDRGQVEKVEWRR